MLVRDSDTHNLGSTCRRPGRSCAPFSGDVTITVSMTEGVTPTAGVAGSTRSSMIVSPGLCRAACHRDLHSHRPTMGVGPGAGLWKSSACIWSSSATSELAIRWQLTPVDSHVPHLSSRELGVSPSVKAFAIPFGLGIFPTFMRGF